MAMKYGDLREVEAELLDLLIHRIKREFSAMRFLEIGVLSGNTVRGVVAKCQEIECHIRAAGVDFPEWNPNPTPLPFYEFYSGDSMDAWRVMKGTFNLLFIDGCHCVNHSMCDFLNYSPFVEVNGYVVFHDTAANPRTGAQDTFPQNHSYAGQPDSVLGVREGLVKLGLLQGYRADWKLIEELPSDDGLFGMVLFQKARDL